MPRIRPWIHTRNDQIKYDTSVTDGVKASPPAASAAKALEINLGKISKNLETHAQAVVSRGSGSYSDTLKNLDSTFNLLKDTQKLLAAVSTNVNALAIYLERVCMDVDNILETFPDNGTTTPRKRRAVTSPMDSLDQIKDCFKQICRDMNDISLAYNSKATVQESDDLYEMINSILSFGRVIAAQTDGSRMNYDTYRAKMIDVDNQLNISHDAARSLAAYLTKLNKQL